MTAARSSSGPLSVPFITSLMVTGTVACPANPVIHGGPADLGFGVEIHYHRCPECYHVWGHARPIDDKGVGWTVEKAVKLMAEQDAASGGYSAYRDEQHKCPKCGTGPVLSWARGPINPELMNGNFFPMMCA